MAGYHISPRTKNVAECDADINPCPFGKIPHFATKEEADAEYNRLNAHLLFPSFKPGSIAVGPLPAEMRVDGNTIRVPKGVYVVGDPFFAVGTLDSTTFEQWGREARSDRNADDAMGAMYNDLPVIGLRTEFGKYGTFGDQHGNEYPVESGSIGLVPMSLLRRMGIPHNDIQDHGIIVTFDKVTTLTRHPNGTLSIGDHLDIYTDEDVFSKGRDPELEAFISMFDEDSDDFSEFDEGSSAGDYEEEHVTDLSEQIKPWQS